MPSGDASSKKLAGPDDVNLQGVLLTYCIAIYIIYIYNIALITYNYANIYNVILMYSIYAQSSPNT